MNKFFANKREVIEHLARGESIKIISSGRVLYMTDNGDLSDIDNKHKTSFANLFYYEVEKYTPPHKYSVDVWFESMPKAELFNNGDTATLFGNTQWNGSKTSVCDKKYRITVEEILE